MSFGRGAIFFTGTDNAASAAFVAADNGLSASTINPQIVVLGQDFSGVANPAGPAALLNSREIPADNGSIFFTIDTALGNTTQIAWFDTTANVIAHLFFSGAGSNTGFQVIYDNLGTGATGQMNFSNFGQIFFTSSMVGLGNNDNANFNFLGRTIFKKQVVIESADYTLSAALSFATHSNDSAGGPIIADLPANPEVGETHFFYIQNVFGQTIRCQGISTIQFGNNVTAAGGSINSVVKGSFIGLEFIGDSQWIANTIIGVWT